MEFPCNFCDRTFDTDHGRGVHIGRKHKEEVKMKDSLKCDMCEESCGSKESLNKHLQEKHIEQLKRKITKEQPIKCYICGFQSSSETAFQIHTEEKHNQTYFIQRETSVTKSPPTKKVKGHHDIDMDTDPLDIVKQRDDEIIDLKSTISHLKQRPQNVENNMTKPMMIGAKDVDKDSGISNKESTYKCEKCEKLFTNKIILCEHMNEHFNQTDKIPIIETPAFPYTCET